MAVVLVCHGEFVLGQDRVTLPKGLTIKTLVQSGQTIPTPTMEELLKSSKLDASQGAEFGDGTPRAWIYNLKMEPVSETLKGALAKANEGGHRLLFLESPSVMCKYPESGQCKKGNHKCGGLLDGLQGEIFLGACMALSGPEVGDFARARDKDPAVLEWQRKWKPLNSAASALMSSGNLAYLPKFQEEWRKAQERKQDMDQALLSESIGEARDIWARVYALDEAYKKIDSNPERAVKKFQSIGFDQEAMEILQEYLPFKVLVFGLGFKNAMAENARLASFEEFATMWDEWCVFAQNEGVDQGIFDRMGTGRVFLLGRLSDHTDAFIGMPYPQFEEEVADKTALLSPEDQQLYMDYINDLRLDRAASAGEEDYEESAAAAFDSYLRSVAKRVLDNNQAPSSADPWQPTKRAVVLQLPAGNKYLFPATGIDLEDLGASPQNSMFVDGESWQLYVSTADNQAVWLKNVGIEDDGRFVVTDFTTEV